MKIKRLLVPLDFSQDSLDALRSARELAGQFGAEILLLHVIEPIHFITVADVYDEQRRLSDTELSRIGAELRAAGQRYHVTVAVGAPSRVIVDTARRIDADLIVMGTHGRTGLAHMLIGSVAEKVVRAAACPVLVTRRTAPKRRTTTRPGTQRRRTAART